MADESDSEVAPTMRAGESKMNLCQINEMIVCKVCSGYLVDATTVTECLHTFCKSCIVKHLEDNINCPECDIMIHQSHPLDYIAYDRTMQDIVYKLVPSLEEDEYKRERDFYAERGMPCPKDMEEEVHESKSDSELKAPDYGAIVDYFRFDEQLTLVLESSNPKILPDLSKKFIRVSCLATITHIMKFIALYLLKVNSKTDEDKYRELDITCDGKLIPKDHTLKYVFVTRWRMKDSPLCLVYSPKSNLENEKEMGKI